MKLSTYIFAIAAVFSTAAGAAGVHNCDTENLKLNRIDNLIGSVRSFANGEVKAAYVSTEEPAAAPDHLLLFVDDGEMSEICFAVSDSADGHGFASLNLEKIKGSVDNQGLLLRVPVRISRGGDTPTGAIVKVRINRTDKLHPKVTIEK